MANTVVIDIEEYVEKQKAHPSIVCCCGIDFYFKRRLKLSDIFFPNLALSSTYILGVMLILSFLHVEAIFETKFVVITFLVGPGLLRTAVFGMLDIYTLLLYFSTLTFYYLVDYGTNFLALLFFASPALYSAVELELHFLSLIFLTALASCYIVNLGLGFLSFIYFAGPALCYTANLGIDISTLTYFANLVILYFLNKFQLGFWLFYTVTFGFTSLTLLFLAGFTIMAIGGFGLLCYEHYPKLVLKCRHRMKKHDMSLRDILKVLYENIPTMEELAAIERIARKNAQQVTSCFQKTLECSSEMEMFLTGSTAERFNAPKTPVHLFGTDNSQHALLSDFDLMISPISERASFAQDARYWVKFDENISKEYVCIFDNVKKEFLNASQIKYDILKDAEKIELKFTKKDIDKVFPSCKELKRTKSHEWGYKSLGIKGPTLQIILGYSSSPKELYLEVTLAIRCLQWPDMISDWSSRPKYWPGIDDIRRITCQGCFLVPKSQPTGRTWTFSQAYRDTTWRISFSLAEVELSKLIPRIARICFVGLKVITKDYLQITCSLITTYHIKCIFLHTLETSDPNDWVNEAYLETGFDLLLKNFIKTAVEKRCPHFWIPSLNLYEDFTDREITSLLKRLQEIQAAPQKFIEQVLETGKRNYVYY